MTATLSLNTKRGLTTLWPMHCRECKCLGFFCVSPKLAFLCLGGEVLQSLELSVFVLVAIVFLLHFIVNFSVFACRLLQIEWRFSRLTSLGDSLSSHTSALPSVADPRVFGDPPCSSLLGIPWPIPVLLLRAEDLKAHLFPRQMAAVMWCEQSVLAVPLDLDNCSC